MNSWKRFLTLAGGLLVALAIAGPACKKAGMTTLDDPRLAEAVFFPRPDRSAPPAGARDYRIPVTQGVELAARHHVKDPAAPSVLFFHGNGEIVPDYDDLASAFHSAGLNLFAVDYRGYGASTGSVSLRALAQDPPIVAEFFLKNAAGSAKPFVMGRSLGSSPACDVALQFGPRFRGLILESGFSDVNPLLELLGADLSDAARAEAAALFSNDHKLAKIRIPVLILHGERDVLISPAHARLNYAAIPQGQGTLKILPGVGHNDMLRLADQYFGALREFASSANKKVNP